MKDFVSFFLLLIVVTIFYIYLETKSLDVQYVKSTIDNREYLVRNLPDKQEAANLLANIHLTMLKVIDVVNDPKNQENYTPQNLEDIKRLTKNYRNGNISESNPGNKYTSYSINKGEKIVFCIRAKDGSNRLEPLNTMLFVAIHELSHLMTKSIGHNQEFWDNMRFLLNDSINSNLYTKEDYFNNPVDYCGTVINDSPLK
jgi:hypothetical protein